MMLGLTYPSKHCAQTVGSTPVCTPIEVCAARHAPELQAQPADFDDGHHGIVVGEAMI